MKGYASGIIDDLECIINNETYYVRVRWYSTANLYFDYEDGIYKSTDIEDEDFELSGIEVIKIENDNEIKIDDIYLNKQIEEIVFEKISPDICYEVD